MPAWARKCLLGCGLLTLVGLLVWGNLARSGASPPGPPVTVTTLAPERFRHTALAPGTVRPAREVQVRALAASPQVRVHVHPGDRVHPGDLLATLAREPLLAAAAEARATLARAEARLAELQQRQRDQPAQRSLAVQQAELELAQARARLHRVRQELDTEQARLAAQLREARAALALARRQAPAQSATRADVEAAWNRLIAAAAQAREQLASRDAQAALAAARAEFNRLSDQYRTGGLRRDHQVLQAETRVAELELALAEFTGDQPHPRLAAAREAIDRATLSLERARLETETPAVTPGEWAAARAALAAAESGLALAEQRLTATAVRAPDDLPPDSVVLAVPIRDGDPVAAGELLVLLGSERLQARLQVDESEIAAVAVGQRVALKAAAVPDIAFHGSVRRIWPQPAGDGMGDAVSGAAAYVVEVDLAGDPASLYPGMSVDAEIEVDRRDGVLQVPLEALFATGDEPHVYVVTGGRAVRRAVTVGARSKSHAVIATGLQPGEQVVVGPYSTLQELRDGQPVQPAAARGEDTP